MCVRKYNLCGRDGCGSLDIFLYKIMIHTVITLLFLTSVFLSDGLEQNNDVQKHQEGDWAETDFHEQNSKANLKQLFENDDKVSKKTDFKKITNEGKSLRETIENMLTQKIRHNKKITDVPESELDRQIDKQNMLDKLVTSIKVNNGFNVPVNGRQASLTMIRQLKPLVTDEKVGTGYTKTTDITNKDVTRHELAQTKQSQQDDFDENDLSSNTYKGKTKNMHRGDLIDFKVISMQNLLRPKRSIYQPYVGTPYKRLDSITNFIRSQLPLQDRHRDMLLDYLSQKYGTWMDLPDDPSQSPILLQPDLLDMLNSSNKRRFNSWGGKRDISVDKRTPLNIWDEERSKVNEHESSSSPEMTKVRDVSKRAKELWNENQDYAQDRIKRPFHSWGGKRNGHFNHVLNANLAVNEGRDDNFEISVQSYNRKLPLFQQEDVNGQGTDKRSRNFDPFPWIEELPFNDERISVSWADDAAK